MSLHDPRPRPLTAGQLRTLVAVAAGTALAVGIGIGTLLAHLIGIA